MILLWLGLALASPELPPVAPQPAQELSADPQDILSVLESDIEQWGEALRSRNLALVKGRATVELIEAHELSLKVLRVRMELAEARLREAPRPLDFDELRRLDLAREAVEAHLQGGVEARVVADLQSITARIERGHTADAGSQAVEAAAFIEEWRDRIRAPERLDAPTLGVVRALGATRPAEAARLAVTCSRRCVGPEARAEAERLAGELRQRAHAEVPIDPLADLDEGGTIEPVAPEPPPPRPTQGGIPEVDRFRVGISAVAPLQAGFHEGSQVRRGFSGALDLAYSATPAACVTARFGGDRWRTEERWTEDGDVIGHDLRVMRGRGELGWCPRLSVTTLGDAVIAVRAVFGVGLATSSARLDGEREALWGLGVHGRIEVPIQLGPVSLVPEVGMSPYGRAVSLVPGSARAPYRFYDRVSLALGLQLGW